MYPYLNPGVITVPPIRTIFSASCFLVSIGHCKAKYNTMMNYSCIQVRRMLYEQQIYQNAHSDAHTPAHSMCTLSIESRIQVAMDFSSSSPSKRMSNVCSLERYSMKGVSVNGWALRETLVGDPSNSWYDFASIILSYSIAQLLHEKNMFKRLRRPVLQLKVRSLPLIGPLPQ